MSFPGIKAGSGSYLLIPNALLFPPCHITLCGFSLTFSLLGSGAAQKLSPSLPDLGPTVLPFYMLLTRTLNCSWKPISLSLSLFFSLDCSTELC